MANNSPGLKSFFWAPDMSFAAFAPSKLIKTAQEKWEMEESRLDLHNHPEANMPPRSNTNSRAQKRVVK